MTLTAGLAVWLLGAAPGGAEGPVLPAEKPAGTGVIVHADGYILTAHHVVANARRIVVVTPGEVRVPALLVSTDQDQDLALLKVETIGLSEAPVGYAGAVRLDQEVIVVGFPFGLREVAVSRGRVAAVRTKGVKRVFQLDAAINPGNSGGPLFNHDGEVVGIVTTKFSHPSGIAPEGMGFSVPISYAMPLLANIPEFDFTAIGKKRKDATTRKNKSARRRSEDAVRRMAQSTVRIEILRIPETPVAQQAGAAAQPPDRAGAESRRAPAAGPPSGAAADRTPLPGREVPGASARTNDVLAAAQRAELEALAQRGILAPDGMVLIPAGEFLMGTEDGLPDARPVHRVVLSSYWIDAYEVTNEQYRRCVKSGVCAPPKDRSAFDDAQQANHPVTNVTWSQARAFCQWNEKRLPTEAEWEKAARGTDGRRYPWGDAQGVIDAIVKQRTHNGEGRGGSVGVMPVGSFPQAASPYGVHELVGNVWEWVKDWYAEDFYATTPVHDPQGPLGGTFRVLRGGNWGENPLTLHAGHRGWDEMTYWGPALGFRCAADAS